MSRLADASVVINNRNYGRFLGEAIDSALIQTYPWTEVIVVDDGSSDDSREVITSYGDRVLAVFKSNGGQGSAFNAGFAASCGEVIVYLDADDVLLPTAVQNVVDALADAQAVKVHWRLQVIDEDGRLTGRFRPAGRLPQGDFRDAAFRLGPTSHLSAPTSGNGWTRRYLERVLPVPESFRQGADTYLFELAPFFGPIRRIDTPQSLFRKHRHNFHARMTLGYKLQRQIAFYDLCVAKLRTCFGDGESIDTDRWRRSSWWHRHALAVEELSGLPQPQSALILVDDATWEQGRIGQHPVIPFLERNGAYYGIPPDDETAIRELERLRDEGAAFLVLAWPAFWWIEHFGRLNSYLRETYPCVIENERVIVFDLIGGQAAAH